MTIPVSSPTLLWLSLTSARTSVQWRHWLTVLLLLIQASREVGIPVVCSDVGVGSLTPHSGCECRAPFQSSCPRWQLVGTDRPGTFLESTFRSGGAETASRDPGRSNLSRALSHSRGLLCPYGTTKRGARSR